MSYMKMLNGAFGTLSAGIDTDDTTIVLTGGHGSRFPPLSAGQCFVATLSNKPANKRETVLVTARSGDTLTVVRAFGDSSAKDWASNDRISIRWDRTMAMQYAIVGGMSEYLQGGGTADAITATLNTLQTTLIDGMRVFVEITTGKNTGNATFTLSFDRTEWGGGVTSGTTKTISRSFVSAVALAEGDISGSNFVAEFVYSAAIDRWVLANPAHGGLSRQYREGVDDDYALLAGGDAVDQGGRLTLYGQSHATQASNALLQAALAIVRSSTAFRVVDAADEVQFEIDDEGNASGDAVASLAIMQANTSGTKLVTAEKVVHCPLVPKHVMHMTRSGDTLTTTLFSEGGISPAYSTSTNAGRFSLTFDNAFTDTNYLPILLLTDGSGAARLHLMDRSSSTFCYEDGINLQWPNGGAAFAIVFGNKAVS